MSDDHDYQHQPVFLYRNRNQVKTPVQCFMWPLSQSEECEERIQIYISPPVMSDHQHTGEKKPNLYIHEPDISMRT